jgi:hypothetical protein
MSARARMLTASADPSEDRLIARKVAVDARDAKVRLRRFGGRAGRDYSPRRSPMEHRKSRPDSSKRAAVRRLMARGSNTITEIAEELGVSSSMLHSWRTRFEQAENTVLKKAAARFAKGVK